MDIINNMQGTNAVFSDLSAGDVFVSDKDVYVKAWDELEDEYFGVDLADGAKTDFDDDAVVQTVAAELRIGNPVT